MRGGSATSGDQLVAGWDGSWGPRMRRERVGGRMRCLSVTSEPVRTWPRGCCSPAARSAQAASRADPVSPSRTMRSWVWPRPASWRCHRVTITEPIT